MARTLAALVALCPLARAEPPSLSPTAPDAARTVILARGLDADQTLALATTLAAAEHPGVLLLDTPGARTANRRFLDEFKPAAVVTIDPPRADGESLWRDLFPNADRGVILNPSSRRLVLQAAALAGAIRAPIVVGREPPAGFHELWLVGDTDEPMPRPGLTVRRLPDEAAVMAATAEALAARGPVETLVLANPADAGIADLAPWVAARHRAALVLTNDKGDNAAAAVRRALAHPALERAENLLILARPGAIAAERRENPLAGRDEFIEIEPLTPDGRDPVTFATGRLFHADPGVVALTLARQRLLPADGSPRTALVASNPGGSLPMLEVFSRVSVHELTNRGYRTTALVGDALSASQLRRRLPEADVFLWEGHHNTLVKDWGFVAWDEPLRPSLMFLQSCLALTEEKASPLFTRGAVAVVGSSSRTYSATGGAFSLAYLDAVLYDGQSLGGALRQGKNFLLAYNRLKEKRLGPQAKLGGANVRSAWAFTLWGDPTLRLPAPPTPDEPAESSRCRVRGDTITLTVPPTAGAEESGKYRVPYRPNARLAGLVRPAADDDRRLVPFVFAEVKLPDGPAGATPRLETKLPDSAWTFVWDARRRAGYVLALPHEGAHEVRFRVTWKTAP
ncbi:MAG TPA: C25 family cysteine peptidase [Gemmataceae bacterium]